jgi:hypothetical protein
MPGRQKTETKIGSGFVSTPLVLVEMAGVEPASRELEQELTTSLAGLLLLS